MRDRTLRDYVRSLPSERRKDGWYLLHGGEWCGPWPDYPTAVASLYSVFGVE